MKNFYPLLLLCYLLNTLEARAQEKYNVIFIIVDDMSIAYEPFGNQQAPTPNFLRLMQHGMLFRQTYCQYALCSPSRTSLLSGQRPDATGVVNNGTDVRWKLGPDYRFLPEYFHDYGYRTESFGKVGPCGHSQQVTWDYTFKASDDDKGFEHTPTWWVDTSAKIVSETKGGINVDSFLVRLRNPVASPYFYGLGFTTHNPFTPILTSWNGTGDSLETKLLPIDKFGTITTVTGNGSGNIILPDTPPDDTADIPPTALTELFNYSDEQVKDLRHAYYGEIIEADANLGAVLDELDRMNIWDSSIVIFTSDHGLHLGEHQGLWLKKTLFEEALRVPLVICAPGKMKGVECDKPVELVDIFPTLTELCGLPTAPNMEGWSLVPLLENPDAAWSEAIFAQRAVNLSQDNPGDPMGRAVRTASFHYNSWLKAGEELYDIINDPYEYTNLVNDRAYRNVLKQMRKLNNGGWQDQAPPSYVKSPFYKDRDGDGYGNSSETALAYFKPDGYAEKGGDCDDDNKAIGTVRSCSENALSSVSSERISIFPNPSAGSLAVAYHSNTPGKIYVNVYDRMGVLVFRKAETAMQGNNTFRLSLYNLRPGVFDLELDNGVSVQHSKFIISK